MLTISNIHEKLREFAGSHDSGILPSMEEEHYDLFYNEARLRYIRMVYGDDSELFSEPFERTQANIDRLNVLVWTEEITVTDGLESDTKTVALPSSTNAHPYMRYIRSRANVKPSGGEFSLRPVRVLRQSEIDEARVDPFNKSTIRRPFIYFENNTIQVIVPENATINKVKLTEIYRPKDVDSLASTPVEDVFEEDQQSEIIQLAVQLILENKSSIRQATNIEHLKELLN